MVWWRGVECDGVVWSVVVCGVGWFDVEGDGVEWSVVVQMVGKRGNEAQMWSVFADSLGAVPSGAGEHPGNSEARWRHGGKKNNSSKWWQSKHGAGKRWCLPGNGPVQLRERLKGPHEQQGIGIE